MSTATVTPKPAALDRIQALEAAHIVPTYRRAPVAFVRGEGVYLFDTEGNRYLDLISGIGVASLGHAHPGLAHAIADQASTLLHTSNLYFHPLQGELAARLAALSGLPRVFFCNSGTEAVEACLKFARRYWFTQGARARTGLVALTHGFAGRSLGSLSVTWDEHYRTPFEPLVPGVSFVPADDPDALRATVTASTAAIIAEPIQGEGGVRPLSPAMAAAIAEVCARTGALLIADEVQCGGGRTGEPFAFPSLGLSPDLVSVGKAVGAGVPVGAALVSERVAGALRAGDHGTTYGGNLLACRAALYVLDQLEHHGLLDHVRAIGAVLEIGLQRLAAAHPEIVEVRGKGLMRGVELDRDAAPVVEAARCRGLLVNRTAERVVRLLPPFIIGEPELHEGLDLLDQALTEAQGDRQ